MRVLLAIAVLMIPVSIIGATAFWNFQNERFIADFLKNPATVFFNAPYFLKLLTDDLISMLYIGASIFYLVSPSRIQKTKALQALRVSFILGFLLNLPIFVLLLTQFRPTWDDLYGFFALIRFGIDLLICLVLWKSYSQSKIPRINISEFTIVEVVPRRTRLLHYIIDVLLMVSLTKIGWALLGTTRETDKYIILGLLMLACFLYFFLSESLFRQTPGQSLTNSCVVGNEQTMSTRKALSRSLLRLIPFDAFSFLWGGNWHDKLSQTTVVRQNSWENLSIEGERQ
ncbi:MAG: RDD family protein [Chitinophagaceae bacterium]|nr:RDD family protein [Chitinophagaceae bacterium]